MTTKEIVEEKNFLLRKFKALNSELARCKRKIMDLREKCPHEITKETTPGTYRGCIYCESCGKALQVL